MKLSGESWQGGGELLLKNGPKMVTLTSHVIDRAGLHYMGPLVLWRF